MDAKSAIEAVEAIRGIVPVEEQAGFDVELTARYGVVADTAGTVAVAETVATPETDLEKRLPDFLNPNRKLWMTEQLGTMQMFWSELGLNMPNPSTKEQIEALEAVLERNPSHRVVPTPLLDLAGRKQVTETAKTAFTKNTIHPDYEALWTPDTSWVYGKLLADPESTVEEGRKKYGLFYSDPDGELVKRGEYVESLIAAGQAVKAEDGTVWTFPVMDVQVRAPRTRDTAGNLFEEKVDVIATPESLIATQLLHQANGTPNPAWEVDFANEAVYELNRHGKAVSLVRVAGVRWNPNDRRMSLNNWDAGRRNDCFGVRAEESGLKS